MRIKVEFKILNNKICEEYKRNIYNHQIYSILLNTLDKETGKKIHDSKKMKRPFCFSDLFLNIKEKKGHFYICGEENVVNSFKKLEKYHKKQTLNNLITGGNILEPLNIKIIKIKDENGIKEKKYYIFNTKFIVNIPVELSGGRKKSRLLEDEDEIEKRLKDIAIAKAVDKKVLLENERDNVNLHFKIIPLNESVRKRKCYARYKEGFKVSWKTKLKVTGDFRLVEFIYDRAGAGENTSSGHGFVFLQKGELYGKKRNNSNKEV